jgi:hypothetical protein
MPEGTIVNQKSLKVTALQNRITESIRGYGTKIPPTVGVRLSHVRQPCISEDISDNLGC